jgi:hypothetical protein
LSQRECPAASGAGERNPRNQRPSNTFILRSTKDRALAETAALLVLSKKIAAVFYKDADE